MVDYYSIVIGRIAELERYIEKFGNNNPKPHQVDDIKIQWEGLLEKVYSLKKGPLYDDHDRGER